MILTLASTYNLPNTAIKVRNLWVFWQSAEQTGSDVALSGVNGALGRQRFQTTTVHTLELVISGDAVVSGSPSSTLGANLNTNVAWLRALCAPTGTGDGTVAASLTLPTGGPLTGTVHVSNLRLGQVVESGKWALATIDVSIPAGELV
jgi:hypothetical protein